MFPTLVALQVIRLTQLIVVAVCRRLSAPLPLSSRSSLRLLVIPRRLIFLSKAAGLTKDHHLVSADFANLEVGLHRVVKTWNSFLRERFCRHSNSFAHCLVLIAGLGVALLSGCGGNISVPRVPRQEFPAGLSSVALLTADYASSGLCSVSVDGFVWYTLPGGAMPPIDFTRIRC